MGIFAADSEGKFWYSSQRLCEAMSVTGLERGGSLLSIHPEDLLTVVETWRGSATPGSRQVPFRIVGPNRVVQSFEGRAIPLIDQSGKVTSFVGYVSAYADQLADAASGLASARLLESLLDKSREIVTVLDEQGGWRYSSGEAWRLLGYRTDFDPAGGIGSLIHPDDREMAAGWFLDVLTNTGAIDPLEARVRAPDGAWRYLETDADNLVSDPIVKGVVLHSRDVTERRQARLELSHATQRLTTLIANFPNAALLEDEYRRIVVVNQAFADLIGMPGPELMVGKTMEELFPGLGEGFMKEEIERADTIVARRETVLGESYSLPDGRAYERDYVPIFVNGEYRGHLWHVRDVSARAKVEAELAALVAAQHEENRRLVELDTVKAEFLSAISHELRSPLTSIVSFTQLLSEGLGHDSVAEQAEFLEIIGRNAKRLLRLVGDLLLLDRIEALHVPSSEMTSVDLPSVVADAVLAIAPQAEQKNVTLATRSTAGPSLTGDAGRLGQLLDNLLSNAVKFTGDGGKVTVRAEPMSGGWLLEVADTGIGIPRSEQSLLFSRFFRATNARSSEAPGSGLGLSVAKAIVDLHHGNISVSSTEGEGTTFTVTLPPRPAGDRRSPMRSPQRLGGSKILVIEDEPDIARAVVALLERSGYQVVLSADGHAGLRMLHSARPDLVLLDIGLPGMDGWNVLERIRDLTTVPILLVTARSMEGDKVRGLQAGADDYLTKPFSNRELVARVDAHLRRSSTETSKSIDRAYTDDRLTVDFLSHEIVADGRSVELTPTEFRLLSVLVRHAGQVLSHDQLLDLGWNDPTSTGPDRVKFAVLRLRRKLGWEDPDSCPIEAVRGFGYRYRRPTAAG